MTTLYHITTWTAWTEAQDSGEYRADSLDTQGFIHLSANDEQVLRVANAIYQGQDDLALLHINAPDLRAEVKHEPPDPNIPAHHYDGELFPHLYGAMNTDAVLQATDLNADDDGVFRSL